MSHQALQQVEKEVREGRVSARPTGNLCIYKYSPDCMMDKLWNDVNIRCRGIVFDTTTGTIVCRSFDKFFNLNERPSTNLKEVMKKAKSIPFRTTEKMDGSMCCVWFYEGKWHCSTPGSLESPQALHAMEHLLSKYDFSQIPHDLTLVCEFIAPMDRDDKVIVYGDREELVLLTAFENKWEQVEIPFGRVQYFSTITGIPMVPVWESTYDNFLNLTIPENKEGYVISFEDGFRVKIKSIAYLKAHRLISEFSRKHILEYIQDGSYRDAVQAIPSAKRRCFDDVYARIMTIKGEIELEVEQWYAKCNPNDMKESAFLMQEAGPIKNLVFMKLRGKEDKQEKYLWKIVEERMQGNI